MGTCIALWGAFSQEERDYLQHCDEIAFVSRYLVPHEQTYEQALAEVKSGRKQTHWMWWIFPQMRGLGLSEHSRFYGIPSRYIAEKYLKHPLLRQHLVEITQAVYDNDRTPYEIFGSDVVKLRSCMQLFASLEDAPAIFGKVLRQNCW